MPINYRCGTEIIKHAQEIDPLIQAHPGAPEGEVRTMTETDTYGYLVGLPKTSPTHMVVARTNTLLIKLSLKLLNDGQPFTFNRGVLETTLLSLLHRATYGTKPTITQLPAWLDSLRLSFVAKRNPLMADLCDCLMTLYRNYRPTSLSQFRIRIKGFFRATQRQSNITLSTIHAAKGSEAHTVIYWGTNKVPHSMAITKSQRQQEVNLEYIARTRAERLLIRVEVT